MPYVNKKLTIKDVIAGLDRGDVVPLYNYYLKKHKELAGHIVAVAMKSKWDATLTVKLKTYILYRIFTRSLRFSRGYDPVTNVNPEPALDSEFQEMETDDAFECLKKTLDKYCRKEGYVTCFFEVKNLREVAQKYGVSHQYVHLVLAKARQDFKAKNPKKFNDLYLDLVSQ